ncbi:hypothetical protein Gotur_011810 [Gossypium turneri]
MSGAESLSDDQIGKGEDSTADHNTKKVWFKNGSDDSLANMVVDSSSSLKMVILIYPTLMVFLPLTSRIALPKS